MDNKIKTTHNGLQFDNQENYLNYVNEKKHNWYKYILNLDFIQSEISKKTIISLGIIPYSRIVLSLIFKKHIIFCAKYCKDIVLIRKFANVICVEERFPKIAKKIQTTGYLFKNFTFQNYLKRINGQYVILFYHVSDFIYETLKQNNISYVGNRPNSQKNVLLKSDFRILLRELDLPHLHSVQIKREEFIESSFDNIFKIFNSSFVCQRGDLDRGGEIATFFINNAHEFDSLINIFREDKSFSIVEVSQFVKGDSLSMIGCVTRDGVLTGSLQTQLIDIKESLHGYNGKGVFVGHDFGLRNWTSEAEDDAIKVTKSIGLYMQKNGYSGVFGVDFIYDQDRQKVYPLECNPRYTGSFPMVSLLHISHDLPPLDFIDLIESFGLDVKLDFEKLDNDYKIRSNFSHVLISGRGIEKMPVDLQIGIYTYNEDKDEIIFERSALLPWEIKNLDEFLVVDSIFNQGADIGQGAVKLMKIIFPLSISESSYKLKPKYAKIIKIFSDLIHDN
jgi:hypothetical protein